MATIIILLEKIHFWYLRFELGLSWVFKFNILSHEVGISFHFSISIHFSVNHQRVADVTLIFYFKNKNNIKLIKSYICLLSISSSLYLFLLLLPERRTKNDIFSKFPINGHVKNDWAQISPNASPFWDTHVDVWNLHNRPNSSLAGPKNYERRAQTHNENNSCGQVKQWLWSKKL